MTSFETVRVAAVQATPVILDAEASVEKACALVAEAAGQGAQLAVLPEAFVPLYPGNAWARGAAAFGGWDELWERLWDNSVDVPGPHVDRLTAVCAEHDVHCAIGVNERESERPGSLYNTLLLIGPEGLLHSHRKLMPTMHERLFHGIGAGDDLGRHRDAARPRRRADLLGEPDAAGALRRLQRRARRSGSHRPPTTPTAGWRRCAMSRSSRAHSWSRCRSTSLLGLSGRLPGSASRGRRGVRQRRCRDHRADLGRGDRRAAVRRGGDR